MTWEAVWYHRWNLLAGALGANVFPLLVLSALRSLGPFDEREGSFITIHMTLVQISGFIFSSLVFGAQASPARLYAYPVKTTTLVAWKMIPAALLVGLQGVLGTLLLNSLFGLHWPVLGPALVVAVAVVLIQGALWLADRSLWMLITVAASGILIGSFYKSRYGDLIGQPTRMWSQVTAGEWVALLLLALLAYGMGVIGVRRNRCGASPLSLGWVEWIDRRLERESLADPSWNDGMSAQGWFEWRTKGWLLPGGVLLGLSLWGAGWLIFSRDPILLTEGLLDGGIVLGVLAVVGGLVLGNTGSDDRQFEMRTFLATRPLTSEQMAHAIFWNALRSLLAAWGLWAMACLVAFLGLNRGAAIAESQMVKDLGWWYFPTTLLLPWIVLTMGMAVVLIGRAALHLKILIGTLSAYSIGSVLSSFVLSSRASVQLQNASLVAVGIILILATVWLFQVALRRSYLRWPAAVFAGAVWGGLSGLVLTRAWQTPQPSLASSVFLIGLMALVVAPLASFPLAITWNRTR